MRSDGAIARYAAQGRFAEGFARGKMRGDPVYRAVIERVADGARVVDAGCGEGYLLALLLDNRRPASLAGFDHDARRLQVAATALAGADVSLWAADIRQVELPEADVICALDVLHYLPPAEQDLVVGRLAGALAEGGALLIRDGHSDGGLSSWVTWGMERLAVAAGRHKGDGVFLRPASALPDAMRAAGLQVDSAPCDARTPFANVLHVGRRP